MPMLRKTPITGVVSALLVNPDTNDLVTEPRESVELDFTGIVGDTHAGLTRAACVRVRQQYPEGTVIRNTRQISMLSLEELQHIADSMQIDTLNPAWVGANIVLQGIPELSKLPPSSRLLFDGGVSLVVDMENAPCRFPGEIIEKHHPGRGSRFAIAAVDHRGVTCWVEKGGELLQGAGVSLHVPPKVTWQHA